MVSRWMRRTRPSCEWPPSQRQLRGTHALTCSTRCGYESHAMYAQVCISLDTAIPESPISVPRTPRINLNLSMVIYMDWVGPTIGLGLGSCDKRCNLPSGIWKISNSSTRGKGALATPTAEQVQPAINYGQQFVRDICFSFFFFGLPPWILVSFCCVGCDQNAK